MATRRRNGKGPFNNHMTLFWAISTIHGPLWQPYDNLIGNPSIPCDASLGPNFFENQHHIQIKDLEKLHVITHKGHAFIQLAVQQKKAAGVSIFP